MDNLDIAKEWFAIAVTDLASAKFLQNMRPVPVEIICYHCQQSAEKFLKGYLAFQGEDIQKTHDLTRLRLSCQQYDEGFAALEKSCLILTDFGVNVRYPFPMDINDADMQMALKHAQQIKDFVLERVGD